MVNEKVKTVGALVASCAVGALVAFGGTALAMDDNFDKGVDKGFDDGVNSVATPEPIVVGDTTYDLEAVEKLLNDADKAKDLSVEDLAELQEKYDEATEKLADLAQYDDLIADEVDNNAAFAEVSLLVKGEDVSDDYDDLLDDLKDDLKEKVSNETEWEVEDVDDFVYIKVLDNDEVVYSLDRDNDDDELEGTVTAEVKVKFHTGGEDGDRHRETFLMDFKVEDGEVVDVDFHV